MKMGAMAAAIGLAGLSLVAATPASAAIGFGSAAILTNRSCPQAVGTNCVNGPRIFTQFAGGVNTGFTASATNMNNLGASASAAASFGSGYLPSVNVGSASGATTRTGGNALAFRSYVYGGSRAINLSLNGLLHFIGSGHVSTGDAAGEGSLNVLLSILPVSAIAGFNENTTGEDLINSSLILSDCSGGARASNGYVNLGVGAGEQNVTIGVSQACGGGMITINPGDSFVVLATLQAISNRGGFLDATHTFSVDYDLVNTVFADTGQSVGAAFLASNIAAPVPEPATWALMILGFGTAGAALRRRRNEAAAAG